MARLRLKNVAWVGLVALSACVVRLNDRNSPAENGAVTGPPADCSVVTPEPRGEIGGPAEPKLVGRYDLREPGKAVFDWSGNYIEARFEGTQVVVGLSKNEGDDAGTDIRFQWILDGGPPNVFYVVQGVDRYELVKDLPPGPHHIVIHRDTEPQTGRRAIFTGFDFGPGSTVLPPIRRARKIEMIGDSITCGYGNEGERATCPFTVEVRPGVDVPVTENQYAAFGSIAGRELDADVTTVCWSGKGVYRNYKDRPREEDQNTFVTMPQFWRRTLSPHARGERELLYDFDAERPEDKPDVVVISLGTNDFTRDQEPDPYMPDLQCVYDPEPSLQCVDDAAKAGLPVDTTLPGDNLPDRTLVGNVDANDPSPLGQYTRTYLEFVTEVRARRPDAHIFLAVPPMITDQFPDDDARKTHRRVLQYIVDARAAAGDTKVYAMELVEQGTRYGLGCDYHPNLEVHRIMADQLVGAIRSKTCW